MALSLLNYNTKWSMDDVFNKTVSQYSETQPEALDYTKQHTWEYACKGYTNKIFYKDLFSGVFD